ncbi:MAG: 50S ribosomal protein L15 [Patescibacteria group bacterium]
MTITLHNLKSPTGSRKPRKRLGRGNASGHGTYSTRGQKGQRARSGGRKGLIQLGVKHFIMRMPKQRGFKSQNTPLEVVKLMSLNRFSDDSLVDAAVLKSAGLCKSRTIKIIGNGKLTKRLQIKVQAVSKGAKIAIEAAGGNIELLSGKSNTITVKKVSKDNK